MLEDAVPPEASIVQLIFHVELCQNFGRKHPVLAQLVQIIDVAKSVEDCLSVIVGTLPRPMRFIRHDLLLRLHVHLHVLFELLESTGESKGQDRMH